ASSARPSSAAGSRAPTGFGVDSVRAVQAASGNPPFDAREDRRLVPIRRNRHRVGRVQRILTRRTVAREPKDDLMRALLGLLAAATLPLAACTSSGGPDTPAGRDPAQPFTDE